MKDFSQNLGFLQKHYCPIENNPRVVKIPILYINFSATVIYIISFIIDNGDYQISIVANLISVSNW